MATVGHIAIYVTDPESVANFYQSTFGLVEVSREPDPKVEGATRICLSDGSINFAVVPTYDEVGLNHIGFCVDDIEEVRTRAINLGATRGRDRPVDDSPSEILHHQGFILDPEGTRIDLTSSGWAI